MSDDLFILLNYFVVFMEAVAFIVFSGAFFQQNINRWRYLLSAILLTSLSFLCLAISEPNVIFKLVLLACVESLWLYVMYHVSVAKCIGVSALFLSFINATDNFFFVAITEMLHTNMQELYQDPYGYYLVCYIAKVCEVMIFTLIVSIIKHKLYFTQAT